MIEMEVWWDGRRDGTRRGLLCTCVDVPRQPPPEPLSNLCGNQESENRKRIRQRLEQGPATIPELMAQTGCSKSTVEYSLKSLKRAYGPAFQKMKLPANWVYRVGNHQPRVTYWLGKVA